MPRAERLVRPAWQAMPTVRLDSVEPTDRWTLASAFAEKTLVCDHHDGPAILSADGRTEREWPDPLSALRWMQRSFDSPSARWVGYLSYDCGRWFESFDRSAVDDLGLPWFAFALVDSETASPVARASRPCLAIQGTGWTPVLRSTFTAAEYEAVVAKAIDYISAGDVFQVNLSQRFDIPAAAAPATVYDRLIEKSPSRFAAFLDFDDFAIASHSPELFLQVTPDRKVTTRPIKGTRPRRAGMEEELLRSTKDAAELNMIVDLERNDLGRVCETGSVRVTRPREIQSLPTIYHGVAEIQGVLRPEIDFVDLLRGTFPGGSVTGAPKVRAMQIIDELEPVRRGPYCGAIGYLAANGSMQFNVAIRTITFKKDHAYVSVGGGIVADSDPAGEYEETLVKAAAMFKALGVPRGQVRQP
jgi:aminodeoxychorismate synthase component I